MDKRKLLATRQYVYQGKLITIPIYLKSNGYKITIRGCYGILEAYCSKYTSSDVFDKFVLKTIKHYKDEKHFIIDRPFYKEDEYIYVLGEKKLITRDSSLKNDPKYFYIKSTCKDPLTVYKKEFLKYVRTRLNYYGELMGFDVKGYIIRTGLFISYYGICFPTKKQFKFDYRLFAYRTKYLDAIVVHELAHLHSIHHDSRFYNFVYTYLKDYDFLEKMVNEGRFDGYDDGYEI